MEDASKSIVFTVGHSNLRSEGLVDLLVTHNIQVLVDVRSIPYSRFAPQFNRESLLSCLAAAGIQYTYEGEALGGRPKDPTCYRRGEAPDSDTKADYLHLVDYEAVAERTWYLAGIDRLIETAGQHRVAIMCSEEDPNRCHRQHLIAQTLLKRGVVVEHMRADGTLERARLLPPKEDEPQQLTLF